jgi:PAS domain S-box-containing protein
VADDTREPSNDEAESGMLERLRAREALLSEAEHIVQMGSFVWEPGVSILWSDEFYRLLGFDPGTVEPSSQAFFVAIHPDDVATVRAARASAGKRGILPELEFRVIRRDGAGIRHIRAGGCVYRHPDGRVQRIVGALHDITHSKRAALALEQALAVSRAAEELAHTGSFVVHLHPFELTLSEGLRKLTGLPAGMLDAPTGKALVHPDDRARQAAWWARLIAGEHVESIQYRIQRPDGATRHFYTRASSTPFVSDGRERVVGTTIDVSERVQLEEDLQRAAKLEAVGTLAAGVAHDFNNYLMVVASALERLPNADPEAEARLISNAQRAVTRCAELTRQLLGFARCQPFSPELVDVRLVVAGLQELFRQSVDRRAELRIVEAEGPLFAHVDARHVEQMLANLIVNAADAIEASGRAMGEVRIVTDQLQLRAACESVPDAVPAGQYTRIRVEDDGGGVAPEFLPRIFEPYFTTKPRGRGTGLGLSAVYGMAHQNGGVVTVEALPAGTRFALWFPVPAQQLKAAANAIANPPLPVRRVLVVDDIPDLCFTTATTLRDAGFEAYEAHSADAALAELALHPVDLVLSDIQMPGRDGHALASELRRSHPGLPVVLMTGYPNAARISGQAEHSRVLHKPFSEVELIASLRAALLDDRPR